MSKIKAETVQVIVTLLKAQVNLIEKQEWFRHYKSLEEFIEEAVRLSTQQKMEIYGRRD